MPFIQHISHLFIRNQTDLSVTTGEKNLHPLPRHLKSPQAARLGVPSRSAPRPPKPVGPRPETAPQPAAGPPGIPPVFATDPPVTPFKSNELPIEPTAGPATASNSPALFPALLLLTQILLASLVRWPWTALASRLGAKARALRAASEQQFRAQSRQARRVGAHHGLDSSHGYLLRQRDVEVGDAGPWNRRRAVPGVPGGGPLR